MRRILLVYMGVALLLPHAAKASSAETPEQRGAYIAILSDCTACHTMPGRPEYAGGLPMNSPLGIIYSTNITPDPTYGIGKYTLEDFKHAVRDGVAKDGHHLYPAMSYPDFSLMTDQDIADLYAYFMHDVKPVMYKPPETKLPFPFNMRWGMALWDMVFAPDKRFESDKNHDASWNRGAYIVRALGHCGSCHTPRAVTYNQKAYSEDSPLFLSGHVLDNWYAPTLRGNTASGLGRWSEEDIANFLKNGHASGTTAFGSMNQAIENSTQHFTDEDRRSVARYLKSLTAHDEEAAYDPAAQTQPDASTYPKEDAGAGHYMALCGRCHGPAGEGRRDIGPPLAGNSGILVRNPTSLIHMVLEGWTSPRTKAGPPPQKMPGFQSLADREVADVLSYIRNSWGNRAVRVNAAEVAATRKILERDNREKQQAAAKAK